MPYNDRETLDQEKWTLDQFEEWQDICLNCGACAAHGPIIPHNNEEIPPQEWNSPCHKCPSLDYYKFKSNAGQGRLLLAANLFQKKTPVTDMLTHIMYTCNSCGVCNEICPAYKPMHVILAAKEEILKQGGSAPEPLPELFENMDSAGNLFGLEKRAKALPDLPTEGENLYFTGCYTSYLLPKIGYANAKILKMAGLDVCHLGAAEHCCGEVARQAGNTELFRKIAEDNIRMVEQAGAKRVIVSCAHCYKTWKESYPWIMQKELPFEVVHITEVLDEQIASGKLNPQIPVEREITFHDPCFLRGKVNQSPRNVLHAIPGLKLKEMERYGRWSYCCGAGAKIALNCYPDYAAEIGRERVCEAKEAASEVVTCCPVCYNQLRFTAKEEQIDLDVSDISLVLAESLGILENLHGKEE
ncbi:MAG: (Fe-S)-binding protein [Lachnospiraceae bacterium]|nr:(Fe-S)-binding protein [Lachnospiraceae bacterium]